MAVVEASKHDDDEFPGNDDFVDTEEITVLLLLLLLLLETESNETDKPFRDSLLMPTKGIIETLLQLTDGVLLSLSLLVLLVKLLEPLLSTPG